MIDPKYFILPPEGIRELKFKKDCTEIEVPGLDNCCTDCVHRLACLVKPIDQKYKYIHKAVSDSLKGFIGQHINQPTLANIHLMVQTKLQDLTVQGHINTFGNLAVTQEPHTNNIRITYTMQPQYEITKVEMTTILRPH